MARKFPLAVCFLFGVVMFLQYFSQHEAARAVNQAILDYWQIVFAFTLILGVFSFARNNVTEVRRGRDRVYRIVGLAGLLSMPVLALIWGIKADTPFMWMFENVQAPMQSTVFALLAIFVASASFRGFRARSLPAAVLLISATVMLLSRSNIGGFFSDVLPDVANWIRDYPSMAARRAILIGIGLGSLTTSLRVMVGIERTWLGGEK
ncbi:MAG: hypothetical protein JSW34_14020 [Candidatus Zixiibacteriota bacterium]|nr:MAG: hypothetical protein JSW34_14020 [candidate division Zixibacteria bacterium]